MAKPQSWWAIARNLGFNPNALTPAQTSMVQDAYKYQAATGIPVSRVNGVDGSVKLAPVIDGPPVMRSAVALTDESDPLQIYTPAPTQTVGALTVYPGQEAAAASPTSAAPMIAGIDNRTLYIIGAAFLVVLLLRRKRG